VKNPFLFTQVKQ